MRIDGHLEELLERRLNELHPKGEHEDVNVKHHPREVDERRHPQIDGTLPLVGRVLVEATHSVFVVGVVEPRSLWIRMTRRMNLEKGISTGELLLGELLSETTGRFADVACSCDR